MQEATSTPKMRVRRSLGGLELATVRHRRTVRRRLRVSDPELTALLYLSQHGAVLQSQLATVMSLSRSGLGALLQRLEQAGLVERRTHPADRRLRLIDLSDAGHEQLARAYRELDAAAGRLLARLSADEVDLVERLLDALADATAAAGGAAPSTAAPPAERDPIWARWG